jgi:hypothetical protein
VVMLSTIPTLVEDGMRPRHADLRPFAVNDGTDVWVLPGGLTRVALPEGQLVVNSSQGGGSKDTWIVGAAEQRGVPEDSPHDIQGLVADQATVTQAIPIIYADQPEPEHSPHDKPARSGQAEQQQQSVAPDAADTAATQQHSPYDGPGNRQAEQQQQARGSVVRTESGTEGAAC